MSWVLVQILLGLTAIFAIGSVLAYTARRFSIGLVTAELLTGIVLGPTVLGRVAHSAYQALFNAGPSNLQAWHSISQTCLMLFLFAAGMELRVTQVRRVRSMVLVGVFGTLIPLIAGFALVLRNAELWAFPSGNAPFIPALVAGTLFSISALPVILRVLYDLRLHRTIVGELIIGGAIIDDLIGWIIFGALVHTVAGQFDWIGGHGVFIAFLAGIAIGNSSLGGHPRLERSRTLIFRWCAPVYFASIGLKVDFAAQWDTTLIIVLLLVSSAAKIAGVTAGAQISGAVGFRQALAIGCGMNARGAMGIVLAGMALNYGFLTPRLFVAFTCVAIVTSVASAPLIRLILRHEAAATTVPPGSIPAN